MKRFLTLVIASMCAVSSAQTQDLELITRTLKTPPSDTIRYRTVRVSGEYAYAIHQQDTVQDLLILDVRDPANPEQVGVVEDVGWRELEAHYPNLYLTQRRTVTEGDVGGYYCGYYEECDIYKSYFDQTLQLDCSNPELPTPVGEFNGAFSFMGPSGLYAMHDSLEIYSVEGWVCYGYDIVYCYWYTSVRSRTYGHHITGPSSSMNLSFAPADVLFDGSVAFLIGDATLQSIQVNNDGSLSPLASLQLPGRAYSIVRSGGYAYIRGQDYLATVSIQHPLHMRILYVQEFSGYRSDLALAGETLIAQTRDTAVIFNLSDPFRPIRIGELTEALSFDLQGERLFVGHALRGMFVYDLSDPSDPRRLGQHPPVPPGLLADAVLDVSLRGDLAFVAAGADGLMILDLSNPQQPTLSGETTIDLFSANAEAVCVDGDRAYVLHGNRLAFIDVSDISAPTHTASWIPQTYNVTDFAAAQVRNDTAFIVWSEYWTGPRFEIYNVGDESSISRIGTRLFTSIIKRVRLDGDYAYLCGSRGLSIFDVSDPTSPVHASQTKLYGAVMDVALVGNYAYAVTVGSQFAVLNVANKSAPVLVAQLQLPGRAEAIAISGSTAYVAANGLNAIDIVDPLNPLALSTFPPADKSLALAANAELIAQADSSSLALFRPLLPTAVEIDEPALPVSFTLGQNYPNPFNPETTIPFSAPKRTSVRLEVFDVLGRRVATLVDEELSAGSYVATWDGLTSDGLLAASGIYLYRLKAADATLSRKMLLLK